VVHAENSESDTLILIHMAMTFDFLSPPN